MAGAGAGVGAEAGASATVVDLSGGLEPIEQPKPKLATKTTKTARVTPVDLSGGLEPKQSKSSIAPPVPPPASVPKPSAAHPPLAMPDAVPVPSHHVSATRSTPLKPSHSPTTRPVAPTLPPDTPPHFAESFVRNFDSTFGLSEAVQSHPSDIITGITEAVAHPMLEWDSLHQMYKGMDQAQQEVIDRAYSLQHSQGIANKANGFAMGVMSAIPMLGPGFVHAADLWTSGDRGGALGTLTALGMQMHGGTSKELTPSESSIAGGAMKSVDAETARAKTFDTYRVKGGPIARVKSTIHSSLQNMLSGGSRDVVGRPAEALLAQQRELAKAHTDAVAAHGVETHMGAAAHDIKSQEAAATHAATIAAGQLEHTSREAGERTAYATGKTLDEQQHNAKAQELIEKYHADTQAALDDVKPKNAKIAADHEQAIEDVAVGNKRTEELLTHRRNLEQQLETKRNELRARHEAAKTKADADEKSAWDETRARIESGDGEKGGSGQGILQAIKAAEDGDLKGSNPDDIRQFRVMTGQLLSKLVEESGGKGSVSWEAFKKAANDLLEGRELESPKGIDIADLMGADISIPFDDLHGWTTELYTKIQERRAMFDKPQDIAKALQRVRNEVRGMMDKIAADNDATESLTTARKTTADKRVAFYPEHSPAASAAEKSLKAKDPEGVLARAEAARVGKVSVFDPEISTISKDIDKLESDIGRLPKESELRNRLLPPPEEPTFVAPKLPAPPELAAYKPPPPPVSTPYTPPLAPVPEPYKPPPPPVEKFVSPSDVPDIVETREAALRTGVSKLGKGRMWDAIRLAGIPVGMYGGMKAGLEYLAGAVVLKELMVNRLARQDFINWLGKPTVQDLNATVHLPSDIQEMFRSQIEKFVKAEKVAGRRVIVNPLLVKVLKGAKSAKGAAGEAGLKAMKGYGGAAVSGAARGATAPTAATPDADSSSTSTTSPAAIAASDKEAAQIIEQIDRDIDAQEQKGDQQ